MGNTMCAEESAEHTVEYTMVEAMKRTRLLESLEASGWARCGRTDKGVSAWANVCSMMVRSGLRGQGEYVELCVCVFSFFGVFFSTFSLRSSSM